MNSIIFLCLWSIIIFAIVSRQTNIQHIPGDQERRKTHKQRSYTYFTLAPQIFNSFTGLLSSRFLNPHSCGRRPSSATKNSYKNLVNSWYRKHIQTYLSRDQCRKWNKNQKRKHRKANQERSFTTFW